MFDTVPFVEVAHSSPRPIVMDSMIGLHSFFFLDTHLTDLRAGVILFRWRRYGRRIRRVFLNRRNWPGKIDRSVQQQRNNRLHLRHPCPPWYSRGKEKRILTRLEARKIEKILHFLSKLALTFFPLFVWKVTLFLSRYFWKFLTINHNYIGLRLSSDKGKAVL